MKCNFFLSLLITMFIQNVFSQDSDSALLKNHNRYFNDVARFFAGMEQEEGSNLKALDSLNAWKKHKTDFSTFYEKVEKERFPQMQNFQLNELKEVNDSIQTLFYPFSGPDFVHANIFFPNAKNIIMIGLERVGSVPDVAAINNKRMDVFFKALRISLDSIFIWGYFMTNDMSRDFRRSLELQGLTPVFMLFMAKSDFEVLDVQKGTISKSGQWSELTDLKKDLDNPKDNYISGVMIRYVKKGEKNIRRLYYFSHDVSDEHLKTNPEFLKFLANQKINVSYFKASSYLSWYFNGIRNLALTQSKYIFQDDSGIEFKYLNNTNWEKTLYGKYTRPIGVFRGCIQPKLREAFADKEKVKPLDFGIGYGFRIKESHLMLFKRKYNAQN